MASFLGGAGFGACVGCVDIMTMGAIGAFGPKILGKKELSKAGAILLPIAFNTFGISKENSDQDPFESGFKVGIVGVSILIAAGAEKYITFKKDLQFDNWYLVGVGTGIVVAIAFAPISLTAATFGGMAAAAGAPPLARRIINRWI